MSSSDADADAHVGFVTSELGTSLGEILRILLGTTLLPHLSSLVVSFVLPKSDSKASLTWTKALIEFPFIVFFPLLMVTFLSGEEGRSQDWTNLLGIFFSTAFLTAVAIVLKWDKKLGKWKGMREFWTRIRDRPIISHKPIKNEAEGKMKIPFITNYRAIVIYVTVIAILAVDFPIFPRRFAKTKKYGYSLMDIGTGSFIFANGIIAPESKGRRSNVRKSLISSIPLFVLGIVRLISVKGIEYHEVVEEYGVHWNFFFTLGAVKVLSAVIFGCIDPSLSLPLSFGVGVLYEYVLGRNNLLEHYLLNGEIGRVGFLDSNREGLYSVWGYLVIFFASVYIGKKLHESDKTTVRGLARYCFQSAFHCCILWLMLHTSVFLGTESCRRAANLSYCLWILATNYTILCAFATMTLVSCIVQNLTSVTLHLAAAPVTLDAVCYNGLFVFLLGNILTGLVNSLVSTIYTPNYLALLYLVVYASTVVISSVLLYHCRVQLKFW